MSVKKVNAVQNLNVSKSKSHEPAKYKNSSYMVSVFQFLQKFRNDDVLCDIRIETNDGKLVLGHKIVFISASPFFREMCTSNVKGKKDHVISIRELDFKVLQLLVDYMYTGEIVINEKNVQDVLPAADLLQLDYVKRACVGYLETQLDPSNCLGIKSFADLFNYKQLLSISEAFIKKQFLEVIKHDEFLSLSSEEVIKLISSNDITVTFEEKVFECVINWVKHELDSRKDFLPDLMEHVRLPLASKEYILEKVVDEPLLKNNPKCKDYVFEALHFNLLKSVNPFINPQTIRSQPRQSSDLQKVILVLGWSTTTNKSCTYWYEPATNILQNAPEMSKHRDTAGLCVIKDQLVFAVGGNFNVLNSAVSQYSVNAACYVTQNAPSSGSSQSVEMLDVSSQALCWSPKVTDLLVSRKSLGVCALDNCIYAVGGFDDTNKLQKNNYGYNDYYANNNNYLNSVEVFNFTTQNWQMVSSMSTKRSNFGVGVLDNLLYAVGGFNGSSYLKSVECYNPSLDKWNKVADMSVCRNGVGIGILDGIMYAIGGTNGSVAQKSVEAYRPNAKMWTPVANMHLCRQNAGVVALDGLLYVISGKNQVAMNSVEIYNPKTNSWSMKTLSISNLQIYGAVGVNRPPHL